MLLEEPRRFTKLLPAVICYPALQCVHVCNRERERERVKDREREKAKEREKERKKERGWKIHTWHPLPAAPNLRGMDSFFPWHSFPSILFIFLQRLSLSIYPSLPLSSSRSLSHALPYSLSLSFYHCLLKPVLFSSTAHILLSNFFSTSVCTRPNFP